MGIVRNDPTIAKEVIVWQEVFQTATDPIDTLGQTAVVSVWKGTGAEDVLADVTSAGLRAVVSYCWCVCQLYSSASSVGLAPTRSRSKSHNKHVCAGIWTLWMAAQHGDANGWSITLVNLRILMGVMLKRTLSSVVTLAFGERPVTPPTCCRVCGHALLLRLSGFGRAKNLHKTRRTLLDAFTLTDADFYGEALLPRQWVHLVIPQCQAS